MRYLFKYLTQNTSLLFFSIRFLFIYYILKKNLATCTALSLLRLVIALVYYCSFC